MRCSSALLLSGSLLLAIGLAWRPAAATQVYECVGADGRKVYQDTPCRPGQRQQSLQVRDVPSIRPAAAAVPVAAAPEGSPPPMAEPAPAAPLPVMYACVRATDGKTYLSANGDPAPYQAPYGMLGAEQQPLSDVYAPDRGAASISAPESNRGRVTRGLVASNYVWVQDQCRRLDPDETCQALQGAYAQNAHKLHNAFQSQRPPLERRDAELRAQLASCGG
ncbi:MAG TPA: DUF4124 domain-containing protein [Frateuria sp.]|uniref:DUF4124 domain-containing protein n=1 Tax=Frateuria sp. TaxID=2211372 RepID=UPI002DF02AEC|nr:DUF4124 domain-containing protein [Frateuria sp.]